MKLCKVLLGRIKIFCYQKIRVKFCSTIICAQYHLRHQHHHLEGAQAMRYLALLLWLQEVRSAGIYSWVHEIAPCSPTAMRLKPWECQHRGGALRHSVAEPGAEWQNWSPQSFQAPYCRGGRLKHRDLPFPTHHNNSAQCARIPLIFTVSSFPSTCNNIKRSDRQHNSSELGCWLSVSHERAPLMRSWCSWGSHDLHSILGDTADRRISAEKEGESKDFRSHLQNWSKVPVINACIAKNL